MNQNCFSNFLEACITGNLEEVKSMASNYSMLNTIEKGGMSPLHKACEGGHFHIVKYILQNEHYTLDPNILAQAASIAKKRDFDQIRSYITLYYIKYCRKSVG